MSKNYDGKRIFYYDVIRTIAILSIILCHTTRIYGEYNFSTLKLAIPGFLNIIGLIGVPLFFMLSGALLLNRQYSLTEFFKKRYSRILLPAIFWMFITFLIFYFILTNQDIYSFIFGENFYTWFIWVICGLYLIIPVINSFIKEYQINGVKYFLVIWVITIILKTFGYYPFHRLELSYFAGFLGYFVLGYYLTNTKFSLNNLTLTILGLISFIIFTILNMFITYNNITIATDYQSIFVVIASIGVFLMIKGLFDYIEINNPTLNNKIKNGKIGDAVFLISACSYGMYFTNSIITRFIKKLDIHSLKLLPLLYIVVIILSIVIVYSVSKIPHLKKFSGLS